MMEDLMGTPDWQLRESNWLLQLGVLLLLFGMLLGGLLGANRGVFSSPLFGLSAHLITLLEGFFLLLIGLLWAKLKLTRTLSRIAFWTTLYSCLGGSLASVLAGIWGAGRAMPIAAQNATGAPEHEMFIQACFYTVAVTTIMALGFILWGLRAAAKEQTRGPV
jgi:(hydroxyamino)benzene mutase